MEKNIRSINDNIVKMNKKQNLVSISFYTLAFLFFIAFFTQPFYLHHLLKECPDKPLEGYQFQWLSYGYFTSHQYISLMLLSYGAFLGLGFCGIMGAIFSEGISVKSNHTNNKYVKFVFILFIVILFTAGFCFLIYSIKKQIENANKPDVSDLRSENVHINT